MDVSSGASARRARDPSGEFAAIERLRRVLVRDGVASRAGEVWIGDDAAVLLPPPETLLFAADAVVAGVHVDLSLPGITLGDLGWRVVASNVSDIAAMGGVPTAAVVTVAGPPETDLEGLYEGVAEASRYWCCPVVGGDLVNAPVLVVTVAIVGDGSGSPPTVRRAGARADDVLFATGAFGAGAAALRLLRAGSPGDASAYLRPLARVVEGQTARKAGATAMIDVSDGFAADLAHLLDASGLGADLDVVPIAPGATIVEALGGGDDYELVFTAPDPVGVLTAFAEAGLRVPAQLGRCTADPGRRTFDGRPLRAAGWEHAWD